MYRKAIVIVISCQSDIYEKSSEIRKIAGKWGAGGENRLHLLGFLSV